MHHNIQGVLVGGQYSMSYFFTFKYISRANKAALTAFWCINVFMPDTMGEAPYAPHITPHRGLYWALWSFPKVVSYGQTKRQSSVKTTFFKREMT